MGNRPERPDGKTTIRFMRPEPAAPVKVIYIAGPSRSGSTLLSNILGEINGFFNGGELLDIWDRAMLQDGKCSCGSTFAVCPVWRDISKAAFAGHAIDSRQMIRMRDCYARSFQVPHFLFCKGYRNRQIDTLQPYLKNLKRLYKGIRASTGAAVIVDASKNVGYGYLLSLVEDVDVYFVHLVRDARATAYSWRRGKKGLWRDPPAKVSLTWLSRNIAGELIGRHMPDRYMRIRYEDFIGNSAGTIARILELADESIHPLPFSSPGELLMGENHSMYGNPDRFRKGMVRLRRDERWQKEMTPGDRLTVMALTWPMLLKYRYARQ